MKSDKQYRDSSMFTLIGIIGVIIVVLIAAYIKPTQTTQNQNNFQVGELTAQDSLELKEPDAIYYDTINDYTTDIDMDCGGSDEYMMWVGDNADTIWE